MGDLNSRKAAMITNALREIFLFDIQNDYSFLRNYIVTITNSYLLDGGKLLKVYLNLFSVASCDCDEDKFIGFLNKIKSKIRYKLGVKLSNKLKYIPVIDFYIDDTRDVCDDVRKLLQKVGIS